MQNKTISLGVCVIAALYASYADSVVKPYLGPFDRVLLVGLSIVGFYYLLFQVALRMVKLYAKSGTK